MTTIGIIGAGQLGQMLGEAGRSLGVDCVFMDPSDNPPAASAGKVLKFASVSYTHLTLPTKIV